MLRQPDTLQKLNDNFNTYIPQMLALQLSSPTNANSLLKNITDFYLGGNSSIDINNPKSVQGFVNVGLEK